MPRTRKGRSSYKRSRHFSYSRSKTQLTPSPVATATATEPVESESAKLLRELLDHLKNFGCEERFDKLKNGGQFQYDHLLFLLVQNPQYIDEVVKLFDGLSHEQRIELLKKSDGVFNWNLFDILVLYNKSSHCSTLIKGLSAPKILELVGTWRKLENPWMSNANASTALLDTMFSQISSAKQDAFLNSISHAGKGIPHIQAWVSKQSLPSPEPSPIDPAPTIAAHADLPGLGLPPVSGAGALPLLLPASTAESGVSADLIYRACGQASAQLPLLICVAYLVGLYDPTRVYAALAAASPDSGTTNSSCSPPPLSFDPAFLAALQKQAELEAKALRTEALERETAGAATRTEAQERRVREAVAFNRSVPLSPKGSGHYPRR